MLYLVSFTQENQSRKLGFAGSNHPMPTVWTLIVSRNIAAVFLWDSFWTLVAYVQM
jgi:hypothetical protein